MSRFKRTVHVIFPIVAGLAFAIFDSGATWSDEPEKAAASAPRPSVEEARGRAKLLHGMIHDTLQIVHSRYFREDDGLPIPAATFKQVFRWAAERDGVELHWLAVDTRAMNIDHKPRDEFEKEAVKVLVAGGEEHERAEDGVYRHVGVITLGADCLKCHSPARSSNKSRKAGLVIAIPIDKE
jgi:hypothetical protein